MKLKGKILSILYSPTNAHLLKTIKIWEVLLQHVLVYTETIIRESISTLLKLHRWFIRLHGARNTRPHRSHYAAKY